MEPDLCDVPRYRYFMPLARGIPRLIPAGRAQLSVSSSCKMERGICLYKKEGVWFETNFSREQNSLESRNILRLLNNYSYGTETCAETILTSLFKMSPPPPKTPLMK
jgi:hypothetical protein